MPTIVTPFTSITSPGRVSSQLPPVSAARSTITEPGRIFSTADAGISFGAGRPGIAAVVITRSKSGMRSASAACCCSLLLGRQLAGVAALGLLADDAEIEEGRAERLHLLADRRAHVEAGHHRAEAARGRDRLEAGNAGAEDERARRRDRSRGGRQHRQEPRQPVGADQNSLVSGDGGLRRERVHRLCPRRSRDRLHREGEHALLAELRDPLGLGQRLQECDEQLPGIQPRELVLRRRRDLDDRVDPAQASSVSSAPASAYAASG